MMGLPAGATDAASRLMERALELAERGLYTTDPNPRVGCVLARGGEIVGEGWHERAGEAHAEVMALRQAGARAYGAVAYVTLEPCNHTGRTPPCTDALINAGVAGVVCAVRDPNQKVTGGGIARLEAAGLEVTVGMGEAAARALNVGFFSRFERGRPFTRLKLAMSLDGRTSSPHGPRWITGEAARADVQALRARSSAVLTGVGTVRADDPRLDVRLAYGPWVRQPLRVVLDSDLTAPAGSRVFANQGALVFTALEASAQHATGRRDTPVRIETLRRSGRGLDLAAAAARLAELGVNELLVECGPRLAAGFLEADLVDELILYVAPHWLGMDAAPLASLRSEAGEGAAGAGGQPAWPRFEFREQHMIGGDLRLRLTPRRD